MRHLGWLISQTVADSITAAVWVHPPHPRWLTHAYSVPRSDAPPPLLWKPAFLQGLLNRARGRYLHVPIYTFKITVILSQAHWQKSSPGQESVYSISRQFSMNDLSPQKTQVESYFIEEGRQDLKKKKIHIQLSVGLNSKSLLIINHLCWPFGEYFPYSW